MKPQVKRKIRKIAFCVFIGLVIVFSGCGFTTQLTALEQKNRELASLNEKIEQQQQKNEELRVMLDEERYSDYIEQIARDKLGYVYSDERVFVDVSGS